MMTKVLDVIFPEYKPFMHEQGYSETSLYILKHLSSPDRIAKMKDTHFETLRKLSRGKFSYPKFVKLKDLASSTIGVTQDYQLFKLKTSISYVEMTNKDIKETEDKIQSLMNQYPTRTRPLKASVLSPQQSSFQSMVISNSFQILLKCYPMRVLIRRLSNQEQCLQPENWLNEVVNIYVLP
jgi:hypothetical protein